jgi:hypothetical protein
MDKIVQKKMRQFQGIYVCRHGKLYARASFLMFNTRQRKLIIFRDDRLI